MTTIPDGFSSITPYITFDDTNEAIAHYIKALGAQEIMRIPGPDGSVMHAEIQIGNARMMMGNTCPEKDNRSARTFGGSPVSFYIYVEDVAAAFEKAKQAGMTERMPLEDMFWGDRIGKLCDPFDVEWTLAQHVRDISPDEIEEAVKKLVAG